jgi:deazaflavin-dependent oxidoreductase (nitroreductase family)
MPIPRQITRFNKKYANPFMRHLSGIGPMAEIEHVGRRTGRVRWTPILAFQRGSTVTVALTYGSGVDWLKNVEAAGSCRLRQGSRVLCLGPALPLVTSEGLDRMPVVVRWGLGRMRVTEFIEMAVLGDFPEPGAERQ